MIALMFVYASVLRMGGFIPTTFFLLLFGSILLGERRWIAMVIVSLAAPLAIWLLVTYVLQRTIVPLPAPLMNLIGGWGMLEGILTGLSAAFTFQAIALVVLGCIIGSFIGMVPGLGPMQVIAIMIPVAVGIGEPSIAMIMLAGVYYGAVFGGSTSSILINAPGSRPPSRPRSTAIPWRARVLLARR